mgnify:CR=1 FL=1
MALKRRHKIDATFSMASMTDVIFLLLIFFMITSTIVFPNSIKVNLPQSNQQAAAKPLTRVTIDENLNYREIVKILNIANDNRLKMVLAAKPVHNP